MIQPEPIIDCTLGGYVTISPLVSGFNLTYSWHIIYPNNKFDVLANEFHSKLTLGPINSRHLSVKYRMLATDGYGNSVYTDISSLQINVPAKTRSFELVKLEYHPLSRVHSSERDPFKEIEMSNYSNSNLKNSRSIGNIFEDIHSEREKIVEFIKDASFSLEKMNSKENQRNFGKNVDLPVFIDQPQSCEIYAGQDLMLECSASKTRFFTWYIDGEPIRGNNSNKLIIHFATKQNEGVYTCTARNEYGFAVSKSVNVVLK